MIRIVVTIYRTSPARPATLDDRFSNDRLQIRSEPDCLDEGDASQKEQAQELLEKAG